MQNLGAQNSDYFSSISFKESFGCSERTHDMVLFSTRPLDKSVIKKYLLHNQNKQGWGGGGGQGVQTPPGLSQVAILTILPSNLLFICTMESPKHMFGFNQENKFIINLES